MAHKTKLKVTLDIELKGNHPKGVDISNYINSKHGFVIVGKNINNIEVIDLGVKKDTAAQASTARNRSLLLRVLR